MEEGLESLVLCALQVDLPNTNSSMPAPLLPLLLLLLLLLLMLPLAGGLGGFPCRNTTLEKEDQTTYFSIAPLKPGSIGLSAFPPSLPPSPLPSHLY